MASMYQTNISKSDAPAMADPSAAMAATKTNATIFGALADIGGEIAGGYAAGKMKNIQDEAVQLQQDFLTTNMQAQKAALSLGTIGSRQPLASGAIQAGDSDTPTQAATALQSFDSQIAQLKEASQAGMSNDQYVVRVNALESKYATQYPGLTDKIREVVGKHTGLVGGSLWAQEDYVKRMFSHKVGPQAKTPEDMAVADMARVAPLGTFGTQEELFTLYHNDRPKYDQRMNAAKDYAALKTQVDSINTNTAGLTGQSDLQANGQRASFVAVFNGSLGSSVLTQTVQDKEQIFSTTLALMNKGENVNVNPNAFASVIDMHVAQMRTSIEASKRAAYSSVDTYLANNPNVSDAKRKELYSDVDRSATIMMDKYGDAKGSGLVAMATIMKTYADKSIAEKSQLIDLAIRQQTAMSNNPMVMAYWAGGSARENLKRTHPAFHSFMEAQEEELTTNVLGIRSAIGKGAVDLAHVETVIKGVQKNPEAITNHPSDDPTVIKATHTAVHTLAEEALKKTDLQPTDINVISSAFATNVVSGANSQLVASRWEKYAESIKKLSVSDQAIIKNSVSDSTVTAVMGMSDLKDRMEAKHKIKFDLGVNDAGEIKVLLPQVKPAQQLTQLSTPEAQKARRDTYTITQAAKDFMNQAAPILNNMVYGRAMVTGVSTNDVAKDFSTIINNKTQYNGFFTMKPQAVVPATPDSTSTSKKVIVTVPGGTITFDTKEQADAYKASQGTK